MDARRSIISVCTGLTLTLVLGNGIAASPQGKELEQGSSEKEAADYRPVTSFSTIGQVEEVQKVAAPLAPLVILYDQSSAILQNATSQNFEVAFDGYDNEGADDFVVTGAGWSVTEVVAPGAYSTAHLSPASMRVTFYADAAGTPGATICNFPALTFVEAPVGTFTIAMPAGGCVLTVGTKWVSVVANLDFGGGGGQWFWSTRTILTGTASKWQNPGGSFATPCATWGTRTTCLAGQTDPDFAYRLSGNTLSCTTDADCNDSNTCTTDTCIPATGCSYTNNTLPCSDGLLCTTGDTCGGGTCNGTPVVCDDGLFCTIDSCLPATGLCTTVPNLCGDGDSCTVDTCDEVGDLCNHSSPPPVHLCNTGAITIPALGTSTPYPATITVSGLGTTASLCSVQLLGLSHTWPGDIDILLVGPAAPSPNAIIMSDVGAGTDAVGVNLTLKDAAAASIPTPVVSGTFKPTNLGAGDPFAAPAPAPSGGSPLSAFNGLNPNGNWSLYVVDDAGGDLGSLATGWCIDLVVSGCTSNADCSDGNLCNGVETCVANACVPGTAVNCDDGQFCTIDSCDPPTGNCAHAANLCGDGDGCTVDSCDEQGDSCLHVYACIHVCNQAVIAINDSATPPTIATPYPSPINISGAKGIFSLVSVELLGLSHTFPADIDMLLAAPTATTNAIIMSDVGGGTDAVGVNLTLTDGAPPLTTAAIVSGTFSPTNLAGSADAFPLPAPLPSGGSALSVFSGTNPNGNWDLFIVDSAGVDSGSIAGGWCLNYRQNCSTATDCDDADPCTIEACVNSTCSHSALGTPGLVTGVTSGSDKQTITWDAATSASRYETVRGDLSALPVGTGGFDEVCLPVSPTPILVDATVPTAPNGFWYVIRGRNDCTVGSYGTQSDSTPRVTTTCP